MEQKVNIRQLKTFRCCFYEYIHFRDDKLDSFIPLIQTTIADRNKMGRALYCQLESSQLESTIGKDRGTTTNTFS